MLTDSSHETLTAQNTLRSCAGSALGRTATVMALALATLLPGATEAQPLPSQQRGVTADTAYQVGEVDRINLFNGNLSLNIPLGNQVPVGPKLAYQLQLSYNSNGWDYEEEICSGPAPGGGVQLFDYFVPEPEERTNAGFAWRLELGRIEAAGPPQSVRYFSPDGGEHRFYDKLHPGGSGADFPPAGSQPNTSFTNDGTYLRQRFYPSNSNPCRGSLPCRTIEFPDGSVHEFHQFGLIDLSTPLFRVVRMRDPFGNRVDVDYNSATLWTLTDSHGREQQLNFNSDGNLQSVVLESFDDSTSIYSLEYEDLELARPQFFPPCTAPPPNTVTTKVLKRVVLPDQSFYEVSYYQGSALQDGILPGGVKELRLPTGGRLGWEYQQVTFGSQMPANPNGPEHPARTIFPVRRKLVYDHPTSSTFQGRWVYTYTSDTNPNAAGDPQGIPCYHTVRVTDPVGNETLHYFSTAEGGGNLIWTYGLPYTRCAPGSGTLASSGPFLSQELYEGSVASGTKVRSVLVDYGSDGRDAGTGPGNKIQDRNHRLVRRRVVFHDDEDGDGNPRYQDTFFEDFDGLGNFRTTRTGGNFDASNSRRIETNYNPDNLTYVVSDPGAGTVGPGNTFVMPALSDPWVLGTYPEQRTIQGSRTEVTQHCFDTNTGFLSRVRTLAGTSPANHDLLRVFDPELFSAGPNSGQSTGRVALEMIYGGDTQGSMDNTYGNLCQMSLPVVEQYRTRHFYASGALRRTEAVDPCDGDTVLVTADFDIDANTGLVAASRDPSGIETVLRYDTMGRLTSERPTSSAWTHYQYRLPTTSAASLQPLLTITRCFAGQSSCTSELSWERHLYDGLGRRVEEQRKIPTSSGVQTQSRHFEYNALGWLRDQSVWGNPGIVTTYRLHDRFGRVGRIKPPEHLPTNLSYAGERVMTRETSVMLASGVQESTFTTEIKDRQGRLYSVCEGKETANGNCAAQTEYGYDSASRLIRVCSQPDGSNCGQLRRFTYDGRGFLINETHPEIGTPGNGRTDYTHDALGNVLSKDVDGSTEFDLEYTYDRIGRLIRVHETNEGNPRLLKEFYYARSNRLNDWRQGKMVLARRHNWVDVVSPLGDNSGFIDIMISESYTYGGRDGRLSGKEMRYHLSPISYAFSMGLEYDPLGNISRIDYPQCQGPLDRCALAAPDRAVTYSYQQGLLTSVPGFANSLNYQSGGLLHQVRHSNNVTYTQSIDPSDGLSRPYNISTTAGWSTGNYSYDGAGNIHKIGNQDFRYDRLQRLVSGETPVGAAMASESATFDAYGNLTQLTTGGSTQSIAVNASTNRLTTGSALYDGAGNLTRITLGGETYEHVFDAAGMMKQLRSTTNKARVFVYNADDERVLTFDCTGLGMSTCPGEPARETWTLRGAANEVLRVYEHPSGEPWEWKADYIHRDGNLLAAVAPDAGGIAQTSHFHPDHLGSPRQITNASGIEVSRHAYHPFGTEATDPGQNEFALKFTGHERDDNGDSKGMMDYMHARNCSPVLGRFLSVDPVLGDVGKSQSWNRYAYVRNNPVLFVDPTGERVQTANERAEGAQRVLLDFEGKVAANTGNLAVDVVLDTLSGSAIDLAVGFLDLFRAGDATGTALGSGASGFELAGAVAQDSLRVAGLTGTGAVAGRTGSKALSGLGRDGRASTHSALRARHHTSPEALKRIKRDGNIAPARGEPVGVNVEVSPFGPAKTASDEVGAAARGAFVEFDLPAGALRTHVGPRKTAVIPTNEGLALEGLNPVFRKIWPWSR